MLPIAKFKEEIINTVLTSDFTIISAHAGVGKSTQIPQYLADYFSQVIVTEPRVIAAKTLARRVANEMGATLGEEVGYKTGLDKLASANSRIIFSTDEYQLIRTMYSTGKGSQKVLIIDEAHEWTLSIEALVAVCKFLRYCCDTKVVIASATIQVEELAQFIAGDVAKLELQGEMFNVTVEERPARAITDTVIEKIREGKNILVFEPGQKEINKLIEKISEEDATVLPLYGELEWEEQEKCFLDYSNPKVIVATNIAQSCLTIPNIGCVIDTGTAYIPNAENGVEEIKLVEISQAEIEQRQKRTGRTGEGEYFLCSDTLISERPKYPVPEIRRSILDKVVLQFESIGIDTEKVEFFHQPNRMEITRAKRELVTIGALDSNNNITELGNRIVKMPVDVKLARMIIEAEKYGVTEQVITIAGIIKNGGLLTKEGKYGNFTCEKNSDLLAELDVWNYITNCISNKEYIKFREIGISYKKFKLTLVYLEKLVKALEGIVELTNKDDRKAILKSCLFGWVSQIYCFEYVDRYHNCFYIGEDLKLRQLNIKSCIYHQDVADFIIGKALRFHYRDSYDNSRQMDIVSFASIIEPEMLKELVPNEIEIECKQESYDAERDAIKVEETLLYHGNFVKNNISYIKEHPRYNELKCEYEQELRAQRERQLEIEERRRIIQQRQKYVKIGENVYDVSYYYGRATVNIDEETLFTTDIDEVFLDNGERVWIYCERCFNEKATLKAIRNIIDAKRIKDILAYMKIKYARIKISNIYDVLNNSSELCEVKLGKNKGGFGEEQILAYVYISMSKKQASFNITTNKEIAEKCTIETLKYLFKEFVESNYTNNKFSHMKGKKKKILTEQEQEMKEDFYSLVREMTDSITVIEENTLRNIKENLEFLEEYYHEIM